MKKKFFFSAVLYAIIIQPHELSHETVLQRIVNTHTKALDCVSFYEKPLEFSKLWQWQDTILNVKQFVQKNTRKKINLFLLDRFDKIHQANKSLITSIDEVYNKKYHGALNACVALKLKKELSIIFDRMRHIQKSLDWVDSKCESERKAIKLVQILAQFIAVTSCKAELNLSILPLDH